MLRQPWSNGRIGTSGGSYLGWTQWAAVPGAGDGTLNCAGYGSLVSVTATFGLCAAGWVMDKLAQSA